LVGYEATNIFRIWIPLRNVAIRTKAVTFDETKFHDSAYEDKAIKEPLIPEPGTLKMPEITTFTDLNEEPHLTSTHPNYLPQTRRIKEIRTRMKYKMKRTQL
jgi:hypothetical protein